MSYMSGYDNSYDFDGSGPSYFGSGPTYFRSGKARTSSYCVRCRAHTPNGPVSGVKIAKNGRAYQLIGCPNCNGTKSSFVSGGGYAHMT